jgi:hypothetical protein
MKTYLTPRYLLPFICLGALCLTLLCMVSFTSTFLGQYQSEKALSSLEGDLEEYLYISQMKRKAEKVAEMGLATSLDPIFSCLPLLNIERGSLELAEKNGALSPEETRRLHFIEKENHLLFRSHKKVENGLFHDVEEKLIHTVQIDENDLATILRKIEGASDYQPSLRIKRLNLERQHDAPHYNLYLELWRKES